MEDRKVNQVLLGAGSGGRRKDTRERCVNVVAKLCTRMKLEK
jgi:hypothetical protein